MKEESIYKFTTLEDLEKYATEEFLKIGSKELTFNLTVVDCEKLYKEIIGNKSEELDFTKPTTYRIPIGVTLRINPIKETTFLESRVLQYPLTKSEMIFHRPTQRLRWLKLDKEDSQLKLLQLNDRVPVIPLSDTVFMVLQQWYEDTLNGGGEWGFVETQND